MRASALRATPRTEQEDHDRGDGCTEPDGVEQNHVQDPDDEAASLGDDGIQRNQVEEPGEVSGHTRYQRGGHRRVAKASDDRAATRYATSTRRGCDALSSA
jgi:hypothetical protein